MGEADEHALPSDASLPLNDVEVDALLRQAEELTREVASLSGVETADPDTAAANRIEFEQADPSLDTSLTEAEPDRGPLEVVEDVAQHILNVEDILGQADMETLAAEYEAARAGESPEGFDPQDSGSQDWAGAPADDSTTARAALSPTAEELDAPPAPPEPPTAEAAPHAERKVPHQQAEDAQTPAGEHHALHAPGEAAKPIESAAADLASAEHSKRGAPPVAVKRAAADAPNPAAAGALNPTAGDAPNPAAADAPAPARLSLMQQLRKSARTFKNACLLTLAFPVNVLLIFLIILDYPFRKLTPQAKSWIAVIGIITLLMGITALVLPKLLDKNPYEHIQSFG